MDIILNKPETRKIGRFVGVMLAFILLLPVAVISFLMLKEHSYTFWQLLYAFFSPGMLTIGLFFSIFGILIGIITSFSFSGTDKGDVLEKPESTITPSNESSLLLARQIWPTLNKARKGLDLIEEKRKKGAPEEQAAVIQVTKDNLDSLFSLLEMLEKEK